MSSAHHFEHVCAIHCAHERTDSDATFKKVQFVYRDTVLHCFQLKMVLVKCCDISNELRPMEVAEPWLDCLLEEYFNQVCDWHVGNQTITFVVLLLSVQCNAWHVNVSGVRSPACVRRLWTKL